MTNSAKPIKKDSSAHVTHGNTLDPNQSGLRQGLPIYGDKDFSLFFLLHNSFILSSIFVTSFSCPFFALFLPNNGPVPVTITAGYSAWFGSQKLGVGRLEAPARRASHDDLKSPR